MKKEDEEKVSGLPENAYRELKDGEIYKPILSPDKQYREVTPWSVFWGLVMAVLFSAAAAFLGLKVGQVFEAAIPIAIIAVGLSSGFKRKNALGENVIIQSIGANSGVIVAGAIFTLPALYILQDKYPEITINFFEVFMSSLLGGILGILLLIPFRKYFVSTMHGKYPFPEATATTQVLVSGEKGGNQAKPLIYAGLIGGLYDFIIVTFGWWSETVSTRIVSIGETLADKAKVVFKVNTGAAVLGLGYIIGLKYSAIICAGSFLVWLVIIPLMSAIFRIEVLTFGNDAITQAVGSMSAEEIFTTYARHIGIGGIATAGVIGIIKSWGIIKGAVGLAAKELKGKTGAVQTEEIRTQKDLSINAMAAVIEPLMSGSSAPWALYAIGAILAIILNFCKIPALAFALGMFIPLELNTPLLIGGLISWYVGSRSKDQALNSARLEKGTLLASGFIAGGALMGVVSAAMRFAGINLVNIEWMESNSAGALAIVMYAILITYLAISSLKAKK